MSIEPYDVIVVGSGNAGFSAAVSAVDSSATRVLLLEKSPEAWKGGNTTFTAGAYRTVFDGLDDVLPLVENVPSDMKHRIDMEPYTEDNFMADIMRVTGGRSDTKLATTLVKRSNETTKWLHANGIKFQLSFNRQAYEIDGRQKFWGGMVLSVVDGGKGLTQQHEQNARSKGIEIRYSTPVTGLLTDASGSVQGVLVRPTSGSNAHRAYEIRAKGGVVLCAGGFEASPSLRAQYLGPGWDMAYVRGTPFNTGDLLQIAVRDCGAVPAGHWSGCHSTCWDADAPPNSGDQNLTNQFTKSGYPLGLMINAAGDRFVDEGLDMRNFTYAKFGREILKQPGGFAYQLWDSDGARWLRKEEYADDVVRKITASSLEELAEKLAAKGLTSPERFVSTIETYNDAVSKFRQQHPNAKFDPSVKDGRSTRSKDGGLPLDKTNWALPIVKPPFIAVKVTCGITFTFGGLATDPATAGVLFGSSGAAGADSTAPLTGRAIPGLFCAGEMLGGLFFENYPGGSGLTAGAVFGRIAGSCAAERASTVSAHTSTGRPRL